MEDPTIPLITAVVTSIGTLITAYFAKFKKDAEVQAIKFEGLEDKYKISEDKITHLLHLIENCNQHFDDIEANQTKATLKSYTEMHKALSISHDKMAVALEKKVDKEVLNAQFTHILSDMERLMRKNDD